MRCRVTLRFLTRSVFNRFHPVDPARETSSESSGLGVGLAIIKSIMSLHSGNYLVSI